METWNLFSTNDLLVAVIGIVGILSVFIVLGSASGKVNKREVTMKEFYANLRRREAEAEAKRLDDESNYDTSSK
jgi:type II secretory pathway pseudopilin PulG